MKYNIFCFFLLALSVHDNSFATVTFVAKNRIIKKLSKSFPKDRVTEKVDKYIKTCRDKPTDDKKNECLRKCTTKVREILQKERENKEQEGREKEERKKGGGTPSPSAGASTGQGGSGQGEGAFTDTTGGGTTATNTEQETTHRNKPQNTTTQGTKRNCNDRVDRPQ
ncbi:hypothetical protein FACS1894152_1270 [Bacilli bacterium]|nr:hypothetical protein FACS1894152_1270 [Bacilli bacterium]